MNKYKTFEELKEELGNNYDLFMYDINLELTKKIDKAIDKLQLLIAIGFDYDGYNQVENLKSLIDELVGYAKDSKEILESDNLSCISKIPTKKANNDDEDKIKITYDLKDIVISALRYALGRRTYVSEEVPSFIMANPDLVDERVCIVMLRDLNRYFEDRSRGIIRDDKCDCLSYTKLQNWLFKIGRDRGYDLVGYERK